MASQVEAVGKETFDKSAQMAMKGARVGAQAATKSLKIGTKVAGKTIKGICLILGKGAEFTTRNVMKAVRDLAYNKTGNIEFSNQNIDMEQLQQSGQVSKIEDKITEEVMKHFNDQCKRFGVKYSAMKDERDPDNPSYMIFYNGKSAEIILQAMKEAYKDYVEAQKHKDNPDKDQAKAAKDKGLFGRRKEKKNESRDSVRAKLAFFRDRVADRERDRDTLEKNVRRADIQR